MPRRYTDYNSAQNISEEFTELWRAVESVQQTAPQSVPTGLGTLEPHAQQHVPPGGSDLIQTADNTQAGLMSSSQAGKLQGIESGAQVNVANSETAKVFAVSVSSGGSGSVSNQTYVANTVPANHVLTGFESDDNSFTITAEIHCEGADWQPDAVYLKVGATVYASSAKETWTQIDDRVFTTTLAVTNATASATYNLSTSDGGVGADIAFVRGVNPPAVTQAQFVTNSGAASGGLYPGVQTQIAIGQTLTIEVIAENHATAIYVDNWQGSDSVQGPFAYSGGTLSIDLAASGAYGTSDGTGLAGKVRVYAVGSSGTPGATFDTSNSVVFDHALPTFGAMTAAYQEMEALSRTIAPYADGQVTCLCTNYAAGDTVTYIALLAELVISDVQGGIASNVYLATKWVRRSAGGYRDDSDPHNYQFNVTRTTRNGRAAAKSMPVEIADDTPAITIDIYTTQDGLNAARLRSDDGSNGYLDHEIRLKANHKHVSILSPNIVGPPIGVLQGSSWTKVSDLEWRRSIRIADADFAAGGQVANDYLWSNSTSFRWTNRAGVAQTVSIATRDAFSLGGFAARVLTHDVAPDHEMAIGCRVVDTAKLTAYNNAKNSAQAFESSIVEHNNADPALNDYFTVSDGADIYAADGSNYHDSDKKFSDSVSVYGSSTITLEETP